RSDEFLELRSKNVENRKKLKHDHRLGRIGYARIVDDLPDDDKGRISGDNVYRRATAWKLAHQDKKGTYKDNTTKDVSDGMIFIHCIRLNIIVRCNKNVFKTHILCYCLCKDEFLRQIEVGITSSEGANDPLTLALGNAEHPGE
ncbi:hypothetical protein Dimus_036044, partial [Dionaea muscipula]